MTKKLYEELDAGELMWMQWAESMGTTGKYDKISNPADKVGKVGKLKTNVNIAKQVGGKIIKTPVKNK